MIPAMYDYINAYNAEIAPSTVHCKNTALTWYFKKYLIEKILSVYEFSGIPETWAENYFMYSIFVCGFVAIIKTDRFGVIPQHCTLYGYDVFYQPTHAVIANPLLPSLENQRIGTECELIRMQPNYSGAWDIVSYYADLLGLAAESAAVNLLNSKFAYVFAGENKAGAETFKKMYDQIASGNPAAFIDKNMFRDDGTPAWTLFTQNLQQQYIAGDVLEDMAKLDSRFNTEIGIPNVNIAKESGVSSSEVAANNIDTMSKCSLWLDEMRRGIDKVNKMFGLSLAVKLRFADDIKKEGEQDVERGDSVSRGSLER